MTTDSNYYYELHIFFNRSMGYSVAITSDRPLKHDPAVENAMQSGIFKDPADYKYVDYVEEIDRELYSTLKN